MGRVILIVLDSVGIGQMPDADEYGDGGSNTVRAASKGANFHMPNMKKLGFFNIDGMDEWTSGVKNPSGAFGRLGELSKGKDTTTGHWEIAGVISKNPMPTFPNGFDEELIDKLREASGRDILCNRPYSGTQVIKDFGLEHERTGALIVYTSADSVLQIAAHNDIVPLSELYDICQKARDICQGKWGVGRVIARPFAGVYPDYKRTTDRHDYSLRPPKKTMLDLISEAGLKVKAVGKINDIFAGAGITDMVRTTGNMDGLDKTIEYIKEDFDGLIFTNLVDYDTLYGHRNDVDGYANALTEFDERLPQIIDTMKKDDVLMITADHGCDPSTPSTDHSREYIPWVIAGDEKIVNRGCNLGTDMGFGDIAATILDYLEVEYTSGEDGIEGNSRANTLFASDADDILAHVDHTILAVDASWEKVRQVCDDAIKYKTASVCISPSRVKEAREYTKGNLNICTVIGFPSGCVTTPVKVFETEDAIANGANEIDMVINIGWVKDGRLDDVESEIRQVKRACGEHILKVIIETCLLTEEEKIKLCGAVTRAGADYIKTSTGFSTHGATPGDVKLMKENVGNGVKVKAAGGISSLKDARLFLELGADRLGTSKVVKAVKENAGSDEDSDFGITAKNLIKSAFDGLKYSYAPYSKFNVSAALLTVSGRIYTGCNIENAALSPGMCAERVAFAKAISCGEKDFRAIAIVGGIDGHITHMCSPCGVCRQVMSEFCEPDKFKIITASDLDRYDVFTLEQLLPNSFGPGTLNRK